MTLEEPNSSPFSVNEEFIKQNQELNPKKIPKKGGPYTKNERDKRMQEVYKLHFDYGYSARKISELMKVNRNTINGDIDYWYSRIYRNSNVFNPEYATVINLVRLEIQRSRLREQLDKTKSFQEKMALERLIYEINCKILYTYNRLVESTKRVMDLSTGWFNKWMEDNKSKNRYMTLFETVSVSEKAKEKINRIIREDQLRDKSP